MANGERSSTLIEIGVQGPHAQDRPSSVAPKLRLRIVTSGGYSSPSAETVPEDALWNQRWACALFERYACLRPLHRVSA